MNCYRFNLEDHHKASWALHEVTRLLPKQPKPAELAPIFYKFFPSLDVEARMKAEYQRLCCPKCGRYDTEDVFRVGFDDPITIQLSGDYGYTHDRIFAVNGRFLKVLKQRGVGGYETKPLGKSGWHALRITLLVDQVEGVIKARKPLCSECGRPKESFGLFEYRHQLSVPESSNTLFTTKTGWPSAHFCDRGVFITEDAMLALKKACISGGYCTRLWTEEEMRLQRAKTKEGIPYWRPPGTLVHLNGRATSK